MATAVNISKPFPSQVPRETMKAAEVQEALRKLGPYSKSIDENGQKLLEYLSKFPGDSFRWIKEENDGILCLNLLRYVYEQFLLKARILRSRNVNVSRGNIDFQSWNVDLDSGIEELRHGIEGLHSESDDSHSETEDVRWELQDLLRRTGELHIVLVGKGSISDQTHTANRLVPRNTITDTILYPPWNCAIDAEVAYGISAGNILPEHRVFTNGEPQGPLPDHWNSMAAQHTAEVPEIILSPMGNEAVWQGALADVDTLYENHNRLVIPYRPEGDLTEFLPPVPLHSLVAVIASLLPSSPSHRVTIHLAAGLEYTGAQPPNEEMWQNQYVHTSDGTVMSMRKQTN